MCSISVKMLVLHLFLVVAISFTSVDSACVLPLPRFRFFAPLIFSSGGALLPTNSLDEHALDINIPTDEEIILSCAPNYFKKTTYNKTKWMNAKCKDGEMLDVNGVEENWIVDLGCELRPIEEILTPVPGCPSEAEAIEFGYVNPIERKTHVIGEACHNEREGRTLFVHTKFVEDISKKTALLEIEEANYLAQQHPDSKYKIDLLIASRLDELNVRLEKLLSTKKVPFLEPRHFIDLPILQNGQLYSTLKLGWNFAVTNGFDHLPNYDLLLKDIMSMNEKSFDLYLGTHSILSLQTETKGAVDLYLLPTDQKYPVPKYLWVVVTTESGKGAGFLVSNDITADIEELTSNSQCESKCAQMTWMSNLLNGDAFKNPKNGFVVCCELDSFMQKVSEMPSVEGKHSLLNPTIQTHIFGHRHHSIKSTNEMTNLQREYSSSTPTYQTNIFNHRHHFIKSSIEMTNPQREYSSSTPNYQTHIFGHRHHSIKSTTELINSIRK